MSTLAEEILAKVQGVPEGTPLVAKELLHLGARAAIDQALSRLARSGQLLRVGRGLYVRPVETRFGQRPPSVARVLESLASVRGETFAPNAAAAANAFGLTTQVPVRSVFLSSGPKRTFTLGAERVEIRHAPRWQLELPNTRAGQALRVLAWYGKKGKREAVRSLKGKLSSAELEELMKARPRLPEWVAKQVGELRHG